MVICIEDRTRFKMLVVATVVIVVGVLAFLILIAPREPLVGEMSVMMLAIAVMVVLIPILMVFKVKRDLKEGFPLVDERGKFLKPKAGYYAFLAMIYIILGFVYYDIKVVQLFEGPGLDPTEYLLLIETMALAVFGGFWLWFAKKGDVSDRV